MTGRFCAQSGRRGVLLLKKLVKPKIYYVYVFGRQGKEKEFFEMSTSSDCYVYHPLSKNASRGEWPDEKPRITKGKDTLYLNRRWASGALTDIFSQNLRVTSIHVHYTQLFGEKTSVDLENGRTVSFHSDVKDVVRILGLKMKYARSDAQGQDIYYPEGDQHLALPLMQPK